MKERKKEHERKSAKNGSKKKMGKTESRAETDMLITG